MITLKKINVTGKFKYLWLKYINGIDLTNHCAKCLLGTYSKKISNTTTEAAEIELDESDAIVYYLCGVSMPYNWHKNFHLAFKEKEGSSVKVNYNGIEIEIGNAERIIFSKEDIDPTDPNAEKAVYATCRNWQFAHHLRKNNIL